MITQQQLYLNVLSWIKTSDKKVQLDAIQRFIDHYTHNDMLRRRLTAAVRHRLETLENAPKFDDQGYLLTKNGDREHYMTRFAANNKCIFLKIQKIDVSVKVEGQGYLIIKTEALLKGSRLPVGLIHIG